MVEYILFSLNNQYNFCIYFSLCTLVVQSTIQIFCCPPLYGNNKTLNSNWSKPTPKKKWKQGCREGCGCFSRQARGWGRGMLVPNKRWNQLTKWREYSTADWLLHWLITACKKNQRQTTREFNSKSKIIYMYVYVCIIPCTAVQNILLRSFNCLHLSSISVDCPKKKKKPKEMLLKLACRAKNATESGVWGAGMCIFVITINFIEIQMVCVQI